MTDGSLWKNRDFRLVLGGGLINNIGDWLLTLALPIFVFTDVTVNGLYGDRLEAEQSVLAIPMRVRRRGEPRPDVAVFLHGLGETEYAWGSPSYGQRLEAELGYTAVFVRFNTGRHISENGASLAALLDDLVAEWPVPVRRIALIGHSMGGLVARSACHRGGDWTRHVSHTVSLGTPGGGGHGDPKLRPDAALASDQAAGYVTTKAAYR